jgi:hypothetical protein
MVKKAVFETNLVSTPTLVLQLQPLMTLLSAWSQKLNITLRQAIAQYG